MVPPCLVSLRVAAWHPGLIKDGDQENLSSSTQWLWAALKVRPGWEEYRAGQALAGVQGRKLRPGGAGQPGAAGREPSSRCTPWGWGQARGRRAVWGLQEEEKGIPEWSPSRHRPRSPVKSHPPFLVLPTHPASTEMELRGRVHWRPPADGGECTRTLFGLSSFEG